MLCQECKTNQANTYIKKVINGKKQEYHLCSQCAEKLKIIDKESMGLGFDSILEEIFPGEPIGNILNPLANPLKCSRCHSTYSEIAASGKVGCGECYVVFAQQLFPYIKQIHGDTVHRGKRPIMTKGDQNTKNNIENLKTQLQNAVDEQNYEKAALLRDKINELTKKTGGAENE